MTDRQPSGWTIGVALGIAALGWSIYSAAVIGARRELTAGAPDPVPAYARRGVVEVEAALHLHTRESHDGAGSYEDLFDAARRAGVPVLLLSEHNNTAAYDVAGYSDGVLIVPGVEVSLHEGHALAWGLSRPSLDDLAHRPDFEKTAALDSLIRRESGWLVIAHPRGARKPWEGALPPAASAIEVVNGDVSWRDDSPHELARALLFYPLDGRAALASLVDVPEPSLAWWDSLLTVRAVFGTAGLDAHGGVRLDRRTSIPFPSYESMLRLVRQHVLIAGSLPADAPSASRLILDALRAGRHFIAFDGFAPARGFSFWAESAGRIALPGEEIRMAPGATIRTRIPHGPTVLVRLVRGGVVVDESDRWDVEFPVREPGFYRLEVYQRRSGPFVKDLLLPWIYSNPIRFTAPR